MNDPIVIVSAMRTPMASFQGALSALSASEIGACAIKAAVEQAKVSPTDIEEVVFGNVLSAGQGQAPARQAAIGAGLDLSTGCTTINKMCGSGMKAVMFAHDQLIAGSNAVMVAGGMESMSNAPYLLPKVRDGLRMGHQQVMDHMFLDGLEDAYDQGRLMGTFAEQCADKYQFSREQQDKFAIGSLNKSQAAIKKGLFDSQICPVDVVGKKDTRVVDQDEAPFNARIDKIPLLRPAFRQDGTVTAANSSSISDGAAALVLMRESEALSRKLRPIAKILSHATHAHEPGWFTTAPVNAISKSLNKINLSIQDIDLFEINEAFSVVTMAAIEELNLDSNRVNVHGGACALGHPIGASGARILVTLLAALDTLDLTTGVAALCIGGGEATSVVVERMN